MARVAPVALLLVATVLSGCGVPSSVEKQAEEVESIAAEGGLLAHDAAEGDTTSVFTRAHAADLLKRVEQLEPAIRDHGLARLARDTGAQLALLERRPRDERAAASVEKRLERAAEAAGEIAQGR